MRLCGRVTRASRPASRPSVVGTTEGQRSVLPARNRSAAFCASSMPRGFGTVGDLEDEPCAAGDLEQEILIALARKGCRVRLEAIQPYGRCRVRLHPSMRAWREAVPWISSGEPHSMRDGLQVELHTTHHPAEQIVQSRRDRSTYQTHDAIDDRQHDDRAHTEDRAQPGRDVTVLGGAGETESEQRDSREDQSSNNPRLA